MSKISVQLISAVRKATGAALNTCKRALEEAKGNVEAAVEAVQKMGHAVAAKKADRATSEGCIAGKVLELEAGIYRGGLLECQSETDFVGTNEAFTSFVRQTLDIGLQARVKTLEELLVLPFDANQTVEQARQSLIGQVGENIRISRYQMLETKNALGLYVHKGRYACLVSSKCPDASVAKDIAVHVVVSDPSDVTELLQQDFYKDPALSVQQYLDQHHSTIVEYIHFVLGSNAE